MNALELTAERLRELLTYDPDTGIFTRISSSRGRWPIGSIAGTTRPDGYVGVQVGSRGSRIYLAHRLAWFWMTGEWPRDKIDHINMKRADNRWSNLRVATHSQNLANVRAHADNASGIKGVLVYNGRWRAMIKVGGKSLHLGLFDTAEAASAAYCAAARKYFGEFARAK